MAARRSFKSDVSFLEKISIGAVGTQRVFEDLRVQGHNPIELERGSQSFKIWKTIKIKRIRVPDLMCVACGIRIESRAKTALMISMSHSTSDPERGWDYGLNDSDFVAFVVCQRAGVRPIDWKADRLVQYVSVEDLRLAEKRGRVISTKPKGVEEGFEARVTWPAAISHYRGKVVFVDPNRLQYERLQNERVITLQLSKGRHSLTALVQNGDSVEENQILAAVVKVIRQIPCRKSASESYYIGRLSGSSLSERYAAAKALSYFESNEVAKQLTARMLDTNEHIYVRLESAASLGRQGNEAGIKFIETVTQDKYLQNRLEAIIVLGEIQTSKASEILRRTLIDHEQHPEIRAGAAWAL